VVARRLLLVQVREGLVLGNEAREEMLLPDPAL
jgi:hypothetical protein